MSIRNTLHSYGSVARALHWATALLILVAWPIGYWAESLPFASGEELAFKAQMFSVHKTLGVAAFFTGLLRVIWALTQVHPAPVSPDHRAEVWVAAFVHWLLYISLLLVPLSGWVHHAASEGFAPILWPFGQDLPLIAKSLDLAHAAGVVHVVLTKVLLVTVILHVAGAMKHAVIDRDGTLGRMLLGRPAGKGIHGAVRGTATLALVLALLAVALPLVWPRDEVTPIEAPVVQAEGGNWEVASGSLGIRVTQMGSPVEGSFPNWSAEIQFDPEAATGNRVEVTIDTATLALGSVSAQATGPEFLNAPAHPTAIFAADIQSAETGYIAKGTLTLNGVTIALDLPFTLEIEGETANMKGVTRLDRRDFGIGKTYADEGSVGFAVEITVELTANRKG